MRTSISFNDVMHDTKDLTTEASTLGLKPGEVPKEIDVTECPPDMAFGGLIHSETHTFDFKETYRREGEVIFWEYERNGVKLFVYND